MTQVYKHVLVALTNPELDDWVLPHALGLAKAMQTKVTLLQVTASPMVEVVAAGGDPPIFLIEQWRERETQALEHLSRCRELFERERLTIHSAVVTGPAAEAITRYASQHAVDLIIMGTHARTGISRWIHGSVAERVLCTAEAPVLLVRASAR